MRRSFVAILFIALVLFAFVLMQRGEWVQTTSAQTGSVELQMRRKAQGAEAKTQLDLKELSLRLESLETYLNVQYNAQSKTHATK